MPYGQAASMKNINDWRDILFVYRKPTFLFSYTETVWIGPITYPGTSCNGANLVLIWQDVEVDILANLLFDVGFTSP